MRLSILPRRRYVTVGSSSDRCVYDDALPSLEQLARQKRYDEIIEIIQFQRKLDAWLCVPNPTNSTALHIIMPYQPPVELVDIMIQSLARLVEPCYLPEATVDTLGRTPLHLAIASQCDIVIVRRLTKMSHHAVLTRDSVGRLPLHWVLCANGGKTKKKIVLNAIATIKLLVDIYPQACTAHDNGGHTPLDLAIQYKCDRRIILLLLDKAQQYVSKYGGHSIAGLPRNEKQLVGTMSTKSTITSPDLPFRVLRAQNGCNNTDDVSSVGQRSFYIKRRKQTTTGTTNSTMAEI